MLQAATSLELAVNQEWAKYKHMVIKLLTGESTSYEPLCVELAKKFITWEDKHPIILTEAHGMMFHWKSTYRGAGCSRTVKPYSNISLLHHKEDK